MPEQVYPLFMSARYITDRLLQVCFEAFGDRVKYWYVQRYEYIIINLFWEDIIGWRWTSLGASQFWDTAVASMRPVDQVTDTARRKAIR